MFKIYTSSNFISDLKKHILKSKFSVELIISEDEFKQISQFLINESIKGLLFEIIICTYSIQIKMCVGFATFSIFIY